MTLDELASFIVLPAILVAVYFLDHIQPKKAQPMPKPFDPTKPVQTRDGRAARIICTDRKGEYPILALVATRTDEYVYGYAPSGRWSGEDESHDLINIAEKRTRWLNVYNGRLATVHATKLAADAVREPQREACLEITYTEGQGLD